MHLLLTDKHIVCYVNSSVLTVGIIESITAELLSISPDILYPFLHFCSFQIGIPSLSNFRFDNTVARSSAIPRALKATFLVCHAPCALYNTLQVHYIHLSAGYNTCILHAIQLPVFQHGIAESDQEQCHTCKLMYAKILGHVSLPPSCSVCVQNDTEKGQIAPPS